MQKYLMLLAGASMLAFAFPSAFERYKEHLALQDGAEALASPPPVVEVALPETPPPAPVASGRTAQLPAGPDGHFRTQAKLNGRAVDVLVDTGATYVAMNEAAARRLGLNIQASDFIHSVQTANGTAAAAIAKLDRIEIGRVTVRDVDVLVTRGDGLTTTLLGMSFLGRLERFGVQSNTLSLVE